MEIKDILFKVVEGNDLTKDETYYIMDKIMKGDIDPAQAGAFLTAYVWAARIRRSICSQSVSWSSTQLHWQYASVWE